MPTLDLANKDDPARLDELAPFKLLAYMCYPTEEAKLREAFLGVVQRETGVSKARRGPLTEEEFRAELMRHGGRGQAVGYLVLAMVQLHLLDLPRIRPSLNRAIMMIQLLLPRHQWDPRSPHEHLPHSRPVLLRMFKKYGPVAHLWAALVHGEQVRIHESDGSQEDHKAPIGPASNALIPKFIAYAEEFSRLYASIPRLERGDAPRIDPKRQWHVKIPENLRLAARVKALPIPPKLLKHLSASAAS